VEVARTVRVAAVSPAATVRVPPVMVVPTACVSSIVQVTLWAGLLVPVTLTVKAWVLPFATLGVEGLTVTALTVGAGAVTVTAAVPDLPLSTVEVARIVRVAALSFAATVRVLPVNAVPEA
jgi:hypothetical protein